jgi:hypothetical protein
VDLQFTLSSLYRPGFSLVRLLEEPPIGGMKTILAVDAMHLGFEPFDPGAAPYQGVARLVAYREMAWIGVGLLVLTGSPQPSRPAVAVSET